MHGLAETIRTLARDANIDALGFAEASEFQGYRLPESIRRNPRLSLADAKTIIVAGIYIGGLTLPSWDNPGAGRTSRLFLSGFFNDVVSPLLPIADMLTKEGYSAVVCDGNKEGGSILPLKLAAVRAGLGWQGKNSLLISKEFGSFLALGGIITNADLRKNEVVEKDHCIHCSKCVRNCPMSALSQEYRLEKSKCLSCLLQNEDFPRDAEEAAGNRIMDCELCQQVCPWNERHIRNPQPTKTTLTFETEKQAWEDFFYLPALLSRNPAENKNVLARFNTGIPYSIFMRNVRRAAGPARGY